MGLLGRLEVCAELADSDKVKEPERAEGFSVFREKLMLVTDWCET